MLTWTKKKLVCILTEGYLHVFTLFSRVFYDHFPGKALRILASKRTKWKNAANTLIWRKYAQNTYISQMSIYYVFVLCDQVYTIWGTFCTIPLPGVYAKCHKAKLIVDYLNNFSRIVQYLLHFYPAKEYIIGIHRIYLIKSWGSL